MPLMLIFTRAAAIAIRALLYADTPLYLPPDDAAITLIYDASLRDYAFISLWERFTRRHIAERLVIW